MALQAHWLRETSRVPGEIPLLVRVVDVEPDDVVGDAVLIKASIHGLHVGFVLVAVAALVVPQRKQGGQRLVAWAWSSGGGGSASHERQQSRTCIHTCEVSILGEELLRAGPQQKPAVDHAAF